MGSYELCGTSSVSATATDIEIPNSVACRQNGAPLNFSDLGPNCESSGTAATGEINHVEVGSSSAPTFVGGQHIHNTTVEMPPPPVNTSPTGDVPLSFVPGDWSEVATTIIAQIGSLFKSGSIDIFGRNCCYESKPRISKFKLVYDGKVWCPGWTAITGKSTKQSQSGALEHAIRDFVNSVHNSGLVSEEDLQEYLRRYNR